MVKELGALHTPLHGDACGTQAGLPRQTEQRGRACTVPCVAMRAQGCCPSCGGELLDDTRARMLLDASFRVLGFHAMRARRPTTRTSATATRTTSTCCRRART